MLLAQGLAFRLILDHENIRGNMDFPRTPAPKQMLHFRKTDSDELVRA